MKYIYFKNPKTFEDLRKQYRELAKKHHPDKGGNDKNMINIHKEYDELFQKLKDVHESVCKDTILNERISLAPIVEAFDNLFDKFNERFFENALQKPVITISKSKEGKTRTTGWCTTERVWKGGNTSTYFEINICPEYLYRPIEKTLATLLHEMVHLYNVINGIQDCSRSNQYHNKKFKETAERHGLFVEKDDSYGYVKTTLRPETLEYINTLNLKIFDLFREEHPAKSKDAYENTYENENKKTSTRKYICPNCVQSVRATREVNIVCGDCNIKMRAAR